MSRKKKASARMFILLLLMFCSEPEVKVRLLELSSKARVARESLPEFEATFDVTSLRKVDTIVEPGFSRGEQDRANRGIQEVLGPKAKYTGKLLYGRVDTWKIEHSSIEAEIVLNKDGSSLNDVKERPVTEYLIVQPSYVATFSDRVRRGNLDSFPSLPMGVVLS